MRRSRKKQQREALPYPNTEWLNLQLPLEYQISDKTFKQDWNIFGRTIETMYRDMQLTPLHRYSLYIEERVEIINLLHWVGQNLFKELAINNETTNHILLRIATGKLNKISLPQALGDELHWNMVQCYKNRLPIYQKYISEALSLPF